MVELSAKLPVSLFVERKEMDIALFCIMKYDMGCSTRTEEIGL